MTPLVVLVEELAFRRATWLAADGRRSATPLPLPDDDARTRRRWEMVCVAADDRERQFRAALHAVRTARRQALAA